MAEVANVYQPLQSPQQQQMNPLQILQLIGQMRSNAIQQQNFEARQNIGNAYKENTGDNGELNTPGLRSQIGKTGGFLAGEGLSQATSNSAADAGLKGTYQQTLHSIFGQLATKPLVTDQDISSAKADAARQGVPGQFIQDYVSSLPQSSSKKSQDARKDWFVSRSNLARGPEATATLTPGNVDPNTGVRPLKPAGRVQREAVGGGINPSLPEGVAGSFVEGQKSLVEDQKASARATANLRNLDIALPMAEKLSHANFGPGSPEFAKIKASLATAGIIDPNTSDVTVRQELNKYLLKYATQAQNAGRSDQALGAAVGSNPNLDLTQPANLGLIKNQIALDKMDAALPKIFKLEHPGQSEAAGYNQYKSDYYDKFDRRVFSYDRLSPEERRDLVQSLGGKNSPSYKKFAKTYEMAKQAGIIVPEKQQ